MMAHISKQSMLIPIFQPFILQWHLFGMSYLLGQYSKYLPSAQSITSSWNSVWLGFPSQTHMISANHFAHVALVTMEKPKADPESWNWVLSLGEEQYREQVWEWENQWWEQECQHCDQQQQIVTYQATAE